MKRGLVIALALTWIFLITLNYYIVHKPFGVENVLVVANALGDVMVAVALFALAAALCGFGGGYAWIPLTTLWWQSRPRENNSPARSP